MKLSKLKEILKKYEELPSAAYRGNDDEIEVVIETAQGGVPTNVTVELKSANMGFDWTSGLFVLRTEKPVVCFNKEAYQNIEEMARKRLEFLKDAYAKCGQKYIPKAREQEWLDGFRDGVLRFTLLVEAENVQK